MVHVGTCFNIAFLWVIDGGCSCIRSSKNKDEPIESDCRSIFVICQWKATLRSVLGSGLETGFFIYTCPLFIDKSRFSKPPRLRKEKWGNLSWFCSPLSKFSKALLKFISPSSPQYAPPSELGKHNYPLPKPDGVTVKAPLLHTKLRCQVASEFRTAANFNSDASHACAAAKYCRNPQRRGLLNNTQ